MDEIRIENLEIYAGHGVFQEENRTGQTFYVNAVLYLETRQAGLADNLNLSVHYGEVSHLINRYLKENTFKLIEAAAEKTAEAILLQYNELSAVRLEVRKPQAPIGLPYESVSVSIKRGWKKAYLGIGSNMGNKRQYIEEALAEMKEESKIRNVKCSPLLETKPYGGVEQEDFLNGAIELETLLYPMELLRFLQKLEAEAGRERIVHWGPRTLDLDILFYENFVSANPELTVPHPDLQNRLFVLEPLNCLSPYLMHPLLFKSVRQLRQELA